MTDGVILVGGEALYDLVDSGDDSLSAHPGGGPFNAARTIGRLEGPVAFLGRLSTDRFGTRMADILAQDGVRLDAVVRTDDPTTLAVAEFDAQGNASYRFYTDGTSAPGLSTQVGAGRTARERRRAARRHARAGARADGHGAGGRRRAARGGGAGGRRRRTAGRG